MGLRAGGVVMMPLTLTVAEHSGFRPDLDHLAGFRCLRFLFWLVVWCLRGVLGTLRGGVYGRVCLRSCVKSVLPLG